MQPCPGRPTSANSLDWLPQFLRHLPGGPAGTEERVLPVAMVVNKALLKKVVVAVLIAAAEAVVTSSVKGKGKPKQR